MTAGRDALRPVTLLGAAAFCVAACLRITDPLLPDIARTFAVTTAAASIVVTAFSLAYGLCQLVYGPIGDRLGKYAVIVAAMAVSAVVLAAAAAAPSLTALAALRLVAGVTTAGILPLALAFVGDSVPYERRQAVLARVLSGQLLGVISGQAAGGILIGFVSWRVVFLLLGGCFGLIAAVLWRELRTGRVVQRRTATPIRLDEMTRRYASLFRDSGPRSVLIAIFLEGLLFFGTLAYLGAFLRDVLALSYVAVGLTLGCFGIGGLCYSLSARRLVPGLGERGMMRVAGLALAASFVALALVDTWTTTVPAMAVLGFGLYMMHNTLQTAATQMAPDARGAAVSLFYACFFLSQAIGAPLIGAAIARVGYGPVFVVIGAGLLGLGLWFAHRRANQLSRDLPV